MNDRDAEISMNWTPENRFFHGMKFWQQVYAACVGSVRMYTLSEAEAAADLALLAWKKRWGVDA